MKNLTILLLILLSVGCKKDAVETRNPGKRLASITIDGKLSQVFQYENNLLVQEDFYTFCQDNPTDQYTYEYKGDKIHKLKTTLRSMYSSTSALCNPASGIKTDEVFEYNSQGQINKIVRTNTSTEFVYNSKGLVIKKTIIGGQKPLENTYEYDAKGNLIKEMDSYGGVAQYEYDNQSNPFYLMKHRPDWISPFNKSPNNVIKATGSVVFKREFQYLAEGLPSQVIDGNGGTYRYNYE